MSDTPTSTTIIKCNGGCRREFISPEPIIGFVCPMCTAGPIRFFWQDDFDRGDYGKYSR